MALLTAARRVRRKALTPCLIARQISKKMMAPMVAVIRLPQKSGMTAMFSLSKREAADNGADQADGEIVQNAAAAAEDLRREPAGDQADDDPGDECPWSRSPSRLRPPSAASGGSASNWKSSIRPRSCRRRRRRTAASRDNARRCRAAWRARSSPGFALLHTSSAPAKVAAGGDADENAFLLRQRLRLHFMRVGAGDGDDAADRRRYRPRRR